MDALLVLGEVPGTDIQITFTTWLAAFILVTAVVITINRWLHRRLIAIQIANGRQPLPAKHLHR